MMNTSPIQAADNASTSTPSPTASASTSINGNANNSTTPTTSTGSNPSANQSRRPPRKSTLTQQQKNQKRQRATQDQLVLLEVEFNKNPTPTASVRERIAQEINMTERSVQIWFQNRRAKIKLLAKKSIETGEDCDAIPESYRQYLAMQAMESGKPLARNFLSQPMGGFGGGMMLGAESHSPQKVVIHHFQCRSLSVGSWRRVGQNAMDLVIFYSLGDKPCLTYYINNDAAGYKIEFPFSYIKNITLENGQSGPPMRPAGLVVELNRPPNFFMDNAGSGGFNQCGDFTEDQQASQILVHHLGGDPRVLSGQLAKLTLLESFQNRHNPMFDQSAIAVSAPVSPIGRPASQPQVMGPPPPPNAFHDDGFGMSLHPGPRGHKRQRSRSVPAITDFSFLSQPMPSFHVQHPSTNMSDASIFAPIPQHANNLLPANNLRINTAPTYGIDFGRQYPMSATTGGGSPSEYASPNFFGPGSDVDPMPSSSFQPSYTLPFLSPMVEHPGSLHPSPSPLSAVSHGDPIIADQSPPLSNMHRSASADFLSMSQDNHHGMQDEGLMLGDMYQKGNFSLPFRGPGMEDGQGMDAMGLHEEPASADLDMHGNMSFNTIDPAALNAGNHHLHHQHHGM